jgi:isoquinoline 1-oxidoreductase alpha subunit
MRLRGLKQGELLDAGTAAAWEQPKRSGKIGSRRSPDTSNQLRDTRMKLTLNVNGESRSVDVDPQTPLLWVLRDELELKGTKFGCGMSLCGACTVHLDGAPTRACVTPVSAVANRAITTIEGIGATPTGGKVQAAWLDVDVVQCGYCQAGQIMTATALLSQNAAPSDADIDKAMAGNLCRCGTYTRIRAAIKRAAGLATTDTREG